MTVKKQTKCSGLAAIVSRQKLQNSNQHIDPNNFQKTTAYNFNISVCFNEKDQLQLTHKEDIKNDDKRATDKKIDQIKIDDITNCVNAESYPNCSNTLVFYVNKNSLQEAIALKFENENDFKRIYFTYKYFKMRNRLTKNSNYQNSENVFPKKKNYGDTMKIRKNSIDGDKNAKSEFDLYKKFDNNGVMHISVQQKNQKYDQPMSLIGIKTDDLGEIDSVIYTEDIPLKPERKKVYAKPPVKPQPMSKDNQKVLKGQYVRVNVDRTPDLVPKNIKVSKIPDILVSKEKPKVHPKNNNVWASSISKVATGYESDREEWRSRSQFSTSAFDSLSKPKKMAFTLRKPSPRPEVQPQYYRFGDPKPVFPRPNNFLPGPQRMIPRPMEIKRNALNNDHRKFTSLQNLEVVKKEKKNFTNRLTGLTNKLKDLGTNSTLGRFRAQSTIDVANLKPVIKKNDGKRAVVRTCSVEPPKKNDPEAEGDQEECSEQHDHRKFTSLKILEVVKKDKKNFTNSLTGLTNKLKDLGTNSTLWRFLAQSTIDVANLKVGLC